MAFLLEQTHSVVVNVVLDILVTTVKPKISVQLLTMVLLVFMVLLQVLLEIAFASVILDILGLIVKFLHHVCQDQIISHAKMREHQQEILDIVGVCARMASLEIIVRFL
jgi:hypothetical protein